MYKPFPMDYPILDDLIEYSRAVLDGEVVACKKHRWACKRFLDDLDKQGTSKFPYIFNQEKALLFLNWMKLFRHRKGTLVGQRIDPHPIQKFIFSNIYGWVHMDTGYRRFNKAYWQVGRKNAKSQSLSCVGSYELMAFGENASEVYCAATKKDQAKIVWSETEAMLRECKELKGKYRVAYNTIYHDKSGSTMRALSKEDKKTGDGFNPQCGVIDEYHAHETTEIYDVIDSGMGARPQPLLMIITTAGHELNNPCYRVEYDLVARILDPNHPYENDQYFAMVNELDKDDEGELVDDVKDPACWEKANPIAASYPEGRKYIADRLNIAFEVPEKMTDVLTKNFNVWVNAREHGYMNLAKWAACKVDAMPDLTGKECYIGVDLSTKIDLTSVGFIFPLDGGKFVVLSHSFMPEETFHSKLKTDKVPYDLWERQGWLTVTDGAVVDYRYIEKYIEDRVEQNGWAVQELCVDPWNATQFNSEMMDNGYEVVEIIQGIKTLAGPTKDFRDQVYQGNIIHDGNPVLAWAMGNAVSRKDHNQNIMLDKEKSRQRIDPVAALMNAYARAMHVEPKTDVSKYAAEEFLNRLWGL